MTTAKTTYTYTELVKRSTTQLIAIYNRLFNTNAYDVWFNPFEHRQDMLVELMGEMDAQKIVAQFTDADRPVEKYKAMKIVMSQDGIAVIWNTGETVNNRKFDDATVALVRQLRAEGESVEMIAQQFGMPRNRVYRICRGDVYSAETPVRKTGFRAARQPKSAPVFTVGARANNEFWTHFGL